MKKLRTISWYPQEIGQCKRFNQTIIDIVSPSRKIISHHGKIVTSYNCAKVIFHSSHSLVEDYAYLLTYYFHLIKRKKNQSDLCE